MEDQKSIAEWRRSVFGRAPWRHVLGRFLEEVAETCELAGCDRAGAQVARAATELEVTGLEGTPEGLADELADLLVLLYGVAEEAGVDLQAALDEKMSVNRERRWRVDGPGLGHHV